MKNIENTGSDACKSGLKNTGAANRGATPTLAYKCTIYVFDEFAKRGYLNALDALRKLHKMYPSGFVPVELLSGRKLGAKLNCVPNTALGYKKIWFMSNLVEMTPKGNAMRLKSIIKGQHRLDIIKVQLTDKINANHLREAVLMDKLLKQMYILLKQEFKSLTYHEIANYLDTLHSKNLDQLLKMSVYAMSRHLYIGTSMASKVKKQFNYLSFKRNRVDYGRMYNCDYERFLKAHPGMRIYKNKAGWVTGEGCSTVTWNDIRNNISSLYYKFLSKYSCHKMNTTVLSDNEKHLMALAA